MDASLHQSAPAAQGQETTTVTIPVTVIVPTKNEENNIRECLASVQGFAEVFVVDSSSGDQTAALASASGASVIDFKWNGDYPRKKQWALENLEISNQWVLLLDAD